MNLFFHDLMDSVYIFSLNLPLASYETLAKLLNFFHALVPLFPYLVSLFLISWGYFKDEMN